MLDRDIDVSDDNLILAEVMEDHGVTAKRLAFEAGRSAVSVHKYCSGERTTPISVWRTLWRLTRDGRILDRLTGDGAQVIAVDLPDGETALDAPTLHSLIQQRQTAIDCEKHILTILADGRIDENDRESVAAYCRRFPDLLRATCRIHAAIVRAYEANTRDKRCRMKKSRS